MLRTFHERIVDEPGELAPLIHPDGEMRLLVTYGRPVHGRAAILDALAEARQADIYHAEITGFEWLDDRTVLTSATARYAIERGGFAAGRVSWLDEFRDGLIWRVTAYRNERAARKAYAALPGRSPAGKTTLA
jgi:hypothetical protein